MELSFWGSRIEVRGNATGGMELAWELDGSSRTPDMGATSLERPDAIGEKLGNGLLGVFGGLDSGKMHTLRMITRPGLPSAVMAFEGAVVTVGTGVAGGTLSRSFLDDDHPALKYTPTGWARYNEYTSPDFNITLPEGVVNGKFQCSKDPGTSTQVLLYGPCYASNGAYTINLDNQPPVVYNASINAYSAPRVESVAGACLRYISPPLAPDKLHYVSMANADSERETNLDWVVVIGDTGGQHVVGKQKNKSNVGAIAGAVAGSVVLLLALVILFFFIRRRRHIVKRIVTADDASDDRKSAPLDLLSAKSDLQSLSSDHKPNVLPSTTSQTSSGLPSNASRPTLGLVTTAPEPQPVPDLSQISSDVNRILAQLGQIRRRADSTAANGLDRVRSPVGGDDEDDPPVEAPPEYGKHRRVAILYSPFDELDDRFTNAHRFGRPRHPERLLLRPNHRALLLLCPLLPPSPTHNVKAKKLPAEAWQRVLGFAMQTEDESKGMSKVRFLLVCKSFQNLATPLLYNSVRIYTLRALELFARTLITSDAKWDSIRRIPHSTPGRWVQRLSLAQLAPCSPLALDSILVRVIPVMPFLTTLEMDGRTAQGAGVNGEMMRWRRELGRTGIKVLDSEGREEIQEVRVPSPPMLGLKLGGMREGARKGEKVPQQGRGEEVGVHGRRWSG
ncbi:hypothetical protein FRC06_010511 [Ceratobasidium sp. 370]|nr:hypothetical protein FRC06_010511 [Ceratobasidium sp. 370]